MELERPVVGIPESGLDEEAQANGFFVLAEGAAGEDAEAESGFEEDGGDWRGGVRLERNGFGRRGRDNAIGRGRVESGGGVGKGIGQRDPVVMRKRIPIGRTGRGVGEDDILHGEEPVGVYLFVLVERPCLGVEGRAKRTGEAEGRCCGIGGMAMEGDRGLVGFGGVGEESGAGSGARVVLLVGGRRSGGGEVLVEQLPEGGDLGAEGLPGLIGSGEGLPGACGMGGGFEPEPCAGEDGGGKKPDHREEERPTGGEAHGASLGGPAGAGKVRGYLISGVTESRSRCWGERKRWAKPARSSSWILLSRSS